MLEKDTNKITKTLECGCVYSFTDYYTSGFQHNNAIEHLGHKYGIKKYDKLISSSYPFTKDKIIEGLTIEYICNTHYHSIISDLVYYAEEYYKHNNIKDNNKNE